jgi:hypothetical protein
MRTVTCGEAVRQFGEVVRGMEVRDQRQQGNVQHLKQCQAKLDEKIKNLSESQNALLARNRRERFEDEVKGRAVGSVYWAGDHTAHLNLLESLAQKFGEHSQEVEDYVENQRAIAVDMPPPNQFSVLGRFSNLPENKLVTATDTLHFLACKRMSESGGQVAYDKALSAVIAENPHLYERHVSDVFVS